MTARNKGIILFYSTFYEVALLTMYIAKATGK